MGKETLKIMERFTEENVLPQIEAIFQNAMSYRNERGLPAVSQRLWVMLHNHRSIVKFQFSIGREHKRNNPPLPPRRELPGGSMATHLLHDSAPVGSGEDWSGKCIPLRSRLRKSHTHGMNCLRSPPATALLAPVNVHGELCLAKSWNPYVVTVFRGGKALVHTGVGHRQRRQNRQVRASLRLQ